MRAQKSFHPSLKVELNFQVSAGLTTSIQSIQFGTKVIVLPRYDQNKRELEVALKADVADLTPPRTGSTILPGRQPAKLQTLVHMKLGQSLILSGIRTRSQTRDSVGLPLLSEIPVLGALFGTQASQKEDVEGAVFIVPSVVESASKGAVDMIKAALSQYQDYSGDLDSVNLYNKKPPVPTDDKLAQPEGQRSGAWSVRAPAPFSFLASGLARLG